MLVWHKMSYRIVGWLTWGTSFSYHDFVDDLSMGFAVPVTSCILLNTGTP